MAAVHLGHSMPESEEEQTVGDILEPKKVTSKKLENASFYHVAAGSGHIAVVSSGYHLNGN